MTRNIATITPNTSIDETMDIFTEKRFRHLPVMNDGRLLGVISIGDSTRWMAEAHHAEAAHLKNYIAGGFAS